jgi:hypothetical protein
VFCPIKTIMPTTTEETIAERVKGGVKVDHCGGAKGYQQRGR